MTPDSFSIDITRLWASRPPKHYNNLKVTDLDPLSKSTIPREIEVQLPDPDGSKVLAIWHGSPPIQVDDYVRCRRDTTDTNVLIVEGAGGATSDVKVLNKLDATTAPTVNDDSGDGYDVGSIWVDVTNDNAYICLDATVGAAVWKPISGSGVWPTAGTANIDAEIYAAIDDFFDDLSNGDLGIIGEGDFTTAVSHQSIPDGASVRGSGVGVTTLDNSSDQSTLWINDGTSTVQDLTVTGTKTTGNVAITVGNSGGADAIFIDVEAIATATSGTAQAFYMFSSDAKLFGCLASASGGGTNRAVYGYNSSGGVAVELHNCRLVGDVVADQSGCTVDIFGGYIDGDVTAQNSGAIELHGLPTITGTVSSGVTGEYRDSDGNIYFAGSNELDVFLSDEASVGAFGQTRNRFGGQSLLTHFRNSTGWSGASFVGSPFESSPTTQYNDDSYYLITSSTTAGAFYQKSPVASPLGKGLLTRVSANQAATYAGIRFDDGTDNNYVMWQIDSQTTSSTINLRQVERIGGGTPTVTTYTIYCIPGEFLVLNLDTVDDGGGNWRAQHNIWGEMVSQRGFFFAYSSTMTWTISRVGLFTAKTGGTTRVGIFDWVAGDIAT